MKQLLASLCIFFSVASSLSATTALQEVRPSLTATQPFKDTLAVQETLTFGGNAFDGQEINIVLPPGSDLNAAVNAIKIHPSVGRRLFAESVHDNSDAADAGLRLRIVARVAVNENVFTVKSDQDANGKNSGIGKATLTASFTPPAPRTALDELWNTNAAGQNPSLINGLELRGGIRYSRGKQDGEADFFQLEYRGNLIDRQGTPFQYSPEFGLPAPNKDQPDGDTPGLQLSFQNGSGALGGNLFEAYGVRPLQFRGLESLRGAARFDASPDNGTLRYSIGLESAPLHFARSLNRSGFSLTNWLVFGIAAEQLDDTDGESSDLSRGILTYRGFVGRAFGWRKKEDSDKAAEALAADILEKFPTWESGQALRHAGRKNEYEEIVYAASSEAESEEEWPRVVREFVEGVVEALADQPTTALWIESAGFMATSGPNKHELETLLTAVFRYWFHPSSDQYFFEARYDTGFNRTALDSKVHNLSLSVSIRF